MDLVLWKFKELTRGAGADNFQPPVTFTARRVAKKAHQEGATVVDGKAELGHTECDASKGHTDPVFT